MIDSKKDLVSSLSTILPTYYELFVDSSVSKPCITYHEVQNAVDIQGESLGYSEVEHDIKLWGKIISDLAVYTTQIDDVMRSLGYTRVSYNELTANDDIEIIMTYKGLGKEYFN